MRQWAKFPKCPKLSDTANFNKEDPGQSDPARVRVIPFGNSEQTKTRGKTAASCMRRDASPSISQVDFFGFALWIMGQSH